MSPYQEHALKPESLLNQLEFDSTNKLCASIIAKYLNWKNIYESLSLEEFASYYNIRNDKLWKCHKQKIIRFVIYNKHKDMKSWSRKQLHLYSPFKNSKSSLLKTHVTWHDAYCQTKENISTIRSKFKLQHAKQTYKWRKYDMNLKSKILTSTKHMEWWHWWHIVTGQGVTEQNLCGCAFGVNTGISDQNSRVSPATSFIDEGSGFNPFWEKIDAGFAWDAWGIAIWLCGMG